MDYGALGKRARARAQNSRALPPTIANTAARRVFSRARENIFRVRRAMTMPRRRHERAMSFR